MWFRIPNLAVAGQWVDASVIGGLLFLSCWKHLFILKGVLD
jgi:hypothetical protein